MKEPELKGLNALSENTMLRHLGIEFVAYTEDSLSASMLVNERTKQPFGYLHGGATCALAETVASVAANLCVDQKAQYCVGLEINCNHIKPVIKGAIIATAEPFHIGRGTQVWHVEIIDEVGGRVAVCRMTAAVKTRSNA